MKTILIEEPGDPVAGFPVSAFAGGDDAGWDTSRESGSRFNPVAERHFDNDFRDHCDTS
jgi:hypothetical protein